MSQLRILIMDTGPLITLAVSESLDYLFLPGLPVIIPDAILYEATIKTSALGADEIVGWTQTNAARVQVISTQILAAHLDRLSTGFEGLPDLGERAALEVARYTPYLADGEQALLLTEDDRLIRGNFIALDDEERVIPMTTYDFLDGLERAQLINSIDAVYARASDAGRLASKRRLAKERHETAMAALQSVLANQTSGTKP